MTTKMTVETVDSPRTDGSFRYHLIPEGEKDAGYVYYRDRQTWHSKAPRRIALYAHFIDKFGWQFHDEHPDDLDAAIAFASTDWDERARAIANRKFLLNVDFYESPFSFRRIFNYAFDMTIGWDELEELTGNPEAGTDCAAKLAKASPWLALTHAEAFDLLEVVSLAGEYAVNNNYDADDEEDPEARNFARNWTSATTDLRHFVFFPHKTPRYAGGTPQHYRFEEK